MSKPDPSPSSDDPQIDGAASDHAPHEGPSAASGNPSESTEPQGADAETGDDLPEWEPLTPELVEEEAQRGDFMLRWAAILLACLLGWTQLDRTETLVHVRSGQYAASHGFLPPRVDVFSASAEGRRWVNLPWLWDLLVGGVDRATGLGGLSILSAALAFATFWTVVQTSVPDVSSWWGAVCAAIAAVACFPSLTATPHIITLLGTAWTIRLLYRWQWDNTQPLWPLVLLFLLWGNFDVRAWIGGVIVVMFAVGTWLDQLRKHPLGDPQLNARTVLIVAVGCAAALLVHPFLWETWRAPLELYGVEYPALRSYVSNDMPYLSERYSAVLPDFWKHLDLYAGLSLVLMVITGVALLLNRARLRLSSVFVLLAVNVIGIAGGREMAVASIVNAMLATINAQQWYRATFRQTYSVEAAELLFSRGGRALTVIAIFGLAFTAVSGRLTGSEGRRVGLGLAPELAEQIESYRTLLEDAFDDRAFNFRLEQGDLLIWIGTKPFIDSRVRLYAGDDGLLEPHQALRVALRNSSDQQEQAEKTEYWTKQFDQHRINQVLPRLSGIGPDYLTFISLLTNPLWQLTRQEAASASFYRKNSGNAELAAYLLEHDGTQFVTRFLRTSPEEQPAPAVRGIWPRPASFYDQYLYMPQRSKPNGLVLAEHYDFLRGLCVENQRIGDAIALAYAAIRSAREGLRVAPHAPAGYRVLAAAYGFLGAVELGIQQSHSLAHPLSGRFYQAVAAYHQVLDCAPQQGDDPYRLEALYRLFEYYDAQGRQDLALKYLQLVEDVTGSTSIRPVTHPAHAEEQAANDARKTELEEGVQQVREQVETALQSGGERLGVAQLAYSAGCSQMALDLLEEDLTVVASNPLARLLMGVLLLECGRTAEAIDQLETLRGSPVAEQAPDWPIMTAYAYLAADDLSTAQRTLEQSRDELEKVVTAAMVESLPLQFAGPTTTPQGDVEWGGGEAMAPVRQTQSATLMNSAFQLRLEQLELLMALIAIESDDANGAADAFESLVSRDPNSTIRPLIEQYLALIADKQLEPASPAELPLEADFFAETVADQTEDPGDSQGADPAAPASSEGGSANESSASDAPTNDTPDRKPTPASDSGAAASSDAPADEPVDDAADRPDAGASPPQGDADASTPEPPSGGEGLQPNPRSS